MLGPQLGGWVARLQTAFYARHQVPYAGAVGPRPSCAVIGVGRLATVKS